MTLEVRSPRTQEEFESYYDLRYLVLRKPWGKEKGSEKDEMESSTFHAALFDGDQILAVGRLQINDPETGQVRYMAVHPTQQNKGLGALVLKYLEKKAFELRLKTLILQAREEATNFYLRNGYYVKEKSFLMYESIQHYLMEKNLSPEIQRDL